MKSTFVLSKKVFILMGCIAGVLIASGICIGIAVSHNFIDKDKSNTAVSAVVNKNEALVNNNENAVSLDDAKKAALSDAGLSESDVSFTQTKQDKDDNVQVYDIEFSTPDKKYEYEINAADGSIIEKDVRTLNVSQSSNSTENSNGDKYIGIASAKEIALRDVKLSASDVKFTKAETDNDNNIVVYDIEFTASNKKYDYEINAVDGSIIEKDVRVLNNQQSSASGNNTDNNAYIGVDKAKEIALGDANVTAGKATFTKTKLDSDERTPKYDIEFRTSDKKYDYEINAVNGNIIEKDTEVLQSQSSGNTNNSYIGVDRAKEIALKDANVTAGKATFTKAKLDSDERTPKYDIEFRTSDKKYDYEINAVNGNIIEKDTEVLQSQSSGNTNNSYIGVDRAKEIALRDANVTAGKATFTKTKLDSDERVPKYDIEFRTSDKKYDYEINAANGNIIEKDIEVLQSQSSGNTSNSYIGVDRAKEIALSNAGLSASDVRFKKAELDRDDGRYEYELEFVSGLIEYEYTIDAVSGKILEHDKDYD